MTNRFLISVAAAALIAGTGLANAQGMNRDSGGAAGGGATAQQAPSERGAPSAAPANRDSGADVKGGVKGEKSAQDAPSKDGMSKDGMSKDRAQSKDAAPKDGMSKDSAQSKDGMKDSAQSKDGKPSGTTAQDSKSGATSTTGQAGAGAKLSTEQRTQISTVIKQQNVQSVTNVNFSISVGTRVPRDVRFYPLPAQVITIYPQWRGYNYILVREEIVIIDPNTFEIVAVISV